MTEITLDENALRYISVFERVTRTNVKDCIMAPNKIVFIVGKGQARTAVGKKGEKVKRLHEMFKKNLDIIEYSDDPSTFIRNIFHNFKIKGVEIGNRGTRIHAVVSVQSKDKGKIIGKDGTNLRLARDILNRHTEIDSLTID